METIWVAGMKSLQVRLFAPRPLASAAHPPLSLTASRRGDLAKFLLGFHSLCTKDPKS